MNNVFKSDETQLTAKNEEKRFYVDMACVLWELRQTKVKVCLTTAARCMHLWGPCWLRFRDRPLSPEPFHP